MKTPLPATPFRTKLFARKRDQVSKRPSPTQYTISKKKKNPKYGTDLLITNIKHRLGENIQSFLVHRRKAHNREVVVSSSEVEYFLYSMNYLDEYYHFCMNFWDER